MKRHLFVVVASVLSGTTALVGAPTLAQAKTPREPVHYVSPDSTYEDIQQAIDEGGTVYFEYGEYDQLADPPRGFNLGANGMDVDIVGHLGPGGERPRINGGNVVFRVGIIPFVGFSGQPVSFRIENLELPSAQAAS